MSDTIRKGIIDITPYENNTGLLMVGNVAALSGTFTSLLKVCKLAFALVSSLFSFL